MIRTGLASSVDELVEPKADGAKTFEFKMENELLAGYDEKTGKRTCTASLSLTINPDLVTRLNEAFDRLAALSLFGMGQFAQLDPDVSAILRARRLTNGAGLGTGVFNGELAYEVQFKSGSTTEYVTSWRRRFTPPQEAVAEAAAALVRIDRRDKGAIGAQPDKAVVQTSPQMQVAPSESPAVPQAHNDLSAAGESASSNGAAVPPAPSFDCRKARSKAELLICSDPELAKLDVEIAGLYREARAVAADKVAVREEGIRELKRRESSCSDRECLLLWYAERRNDLLAVVRFGAERSPRTQ